MSEVSNLAPSEIRTRLEYQGFTDGVYQFPSVSVKAIPWCTTHGHQIPGGDNPDNRCWFSFRYEVQAPNGEILTDTCVASTGGPEHLWWVDA